MDLNFTELASYAPIEYFGDNIDKLILVIVDIERD